MRMIDTFLKPMHPEGWKFVAIFGAVSLVLFWIWDPLGWLGLGLTVWCYYFFRDPKRAVPQNAGLLVSPPTQDVVEWWDTISHEVKLETDLDKMAQARAAEKLTWDAEKERLLAMGIDTDPIWVGLDDNTAGYDILSYELAEAGTVNKLIEVKSTVASPLRFFVTRNEWTQAQKAKDSYFFHVWDMKKSPPVLHIRTVEQVEPHIPTDNDKGKWSNAEIPVGA